jgi:hypothetical protein
MAKASRNRPEAGANLMMRLSDAQVPAGTPVDLIEAARLGARIATRRHCSTGQDVTAVRRQVIAGFRRTLAADHSEYECETLMMAVQQGIEDVLG